MSKPFNFKQFQVSQDLCAMKVGTDGVLLGAWVNCASAKIILDVGTGTGLLTLMLAQRSPNVQKIDAIDIDRGAFEQAKFNFEQSSWDNILNSKNTSLQELNTNSKYDLIVSNPPYFQSGPKLSTKSRELARYNDSLSFNDLFIHTKKVLSKNGSLAVILPYSSKEDLIDSAAAVEFTPSRICNVKTRASKSFERIMVEFKQGNDNECIQEELVLLEGKGRHDYTIEYTNMVKEFYTIL